MKQVRFLAVLMIIPGLSWCQVSKMPSVTIGNQVWTTDNLDVDHFLNGEKIPEAKTDEEWSKAAREKKPAWCYLNDDPANSKKYGRLYNFYAITDPRKLTPKGWHIPSQTEWLELINFLGGDNVAGEPLKNKEAWPKRATGTSGFNALPGGSRYEDGSFARSPYASFWGSTASEHYVYAQSMVDLGLGEVNFTAGEGCSVRFVKDK